ncbi:MAG: phosphoribosyltransferase [Bacteroidota bacterium]
MSGSHPLFVDRIDAGKQLAHKLEDLRNSDTLVLGIPRGGVPVAAEIARQLQLPLGLELVKKIGHPDNPEYAIGSVSADGIYLRPEAERIDMEYIKNETTRIRSLVHERQEQLTGTATVTDVRNRDVILVDDGIATGSTLLEAIRDLGQRGAQPIIVAVPVAPPGTGIRIGTSCDRFVCLYEPEGFSIVGEYYADFSPVEDEEVTSLFRSFSH